MQTNKLRFGIFEYIAAFLLFLVFRPSFTWEMNVFFILIPLAGVLILKVDLKEKSKLLLFLFFFLTLSIIPVAHGASVLGFLFYTVFAVIPFLKKDFAIGTFHLFRTLMAGITAISLIVWVMVVRLQIDLPHSVIPPLNDLKQHFYLSYPFLVVPLQFSDAFRFSCFFDEPGIVGTYSLLFLYIGSFSMKKWQNFIFLIAGIVSFSLFFYISLVFFLLFRVFTTRNLNKYRLWAIVGIAALFVAVQVSPVMNELIGARLQYDEGKGFTGNNRSGEDLNNYIASIRGTSKYLWGDTADIVENFNGNASLNNAILRYGFVFIVCFFVFYFLYARNALKGKRIELIMTMLLLFFTLYQRPAFVDPAYTFLFTMAILAHQYPIEDSRKTKSRSLLQTNRIQVWK